MEPIIIAKQHYYLPRDIDGIEQLFELALDLHWSWNHSSDELWGQLEPELWAVSHNPWVVLQTVSRTKLRTLSADPVFRQRIEALVRKQQEYMAAPAWFQNAHAQAPLTSIAYFSMEFMLSEALPIYSGGLGNVAGDQLKTASDLGVPVVGVGLFYQQGYFRQVIDAQGAQRALYPYNDPMQLPITPVRDEDGEWVRLEIALPGHRVWLRAWQVQVGRAKLYLLDSNDPANMPTERGITSELYGGGPELRLVQELMLGIGGWRLLHTLGIEPEVCHLNEGHAAFAVLERASAFRQTANVSFDVALAVTRAGNLFTSHTPVSAGFDRFSSSLVEQYLGEYARKQLGIDSNELLALGRQNPHDQTEPFNMAYLAIRGSGAVNGVSRLHGEVSRKIFQPLFPRWPQVETPIGHVTNGIHVPSWDSPEADELWTKTCGHERWRGKLETVEEELRCVSDDDLWQLRSKSRLHLIHHTRERLARQLIAIGAAAEKIEQARRIFDPNVLTLGFARRFTTYKRPNLLLHDPERLLRLLTNKRYPVQLLIAGKAHPQDDAGQAMIKAWTHFIRRSEVRPHVVFLSDYDMLLTEQLVQGVDVWLNTPRRPWEACGTSGMKVLVNGGLNISELDGWWAEAYTPEVGWALGDGCEHDSDPEWDAAEAEALYDLLEHEVIPLFYDRDLNGLPGKWVARMRESMARLTPRFSTNRTVREYTERYYLPAAAAYRKRAADQGALGAQILHWRCAVSQQWASAHFGDLKVTSSNHHHEFHVQVYLGELPTEAVRVELYADAQVGGSSVRQEMARRQGLIGAINGYVYQTVVPADRPAEDYTPRLIPYHPDAAVPLEAPQILWFR
ncbi:MAG: alpha-glucan family phosphorylase [Candidatus Binatia bacterium]